MFDRIFDVNLDGKTDAFELALGLSIAFSDEDKADDFDEEIGFDSDLDCLDDEEGDDDLASEIHINILENERRTLEYQLSELQDKLFDLEMEEPDDCTSAAYDRWERRRDLLEEQISELEDQISEIDDLM